MQGFDGGAGQAMRLAEIPLKKSAGRAARVRQGLFRLFWIRQAADAASTICSVRAARRRERPQKRRAQTERCFRLRPGAGAKSWDGDVRVKERAGDRAKQRGGRADGWSMPEALNVQTSIARGVSQTIFVLSDRVQPYRSSAPEPVSAFSSPAAPKTAGGRETQAFPRKPSKASEKLEFTSKGG